MKYSKVLVAFGMCIGCSASSTAADGDTTRVPAGPESLSLSQGSLTLAPGRDAWLSVSTFIKTSPSALTQVPPSVTFESSNPDVATVALDSVEYGHVVAKAVGTATITVRSRRDSNSLARAIVTVRSAPASNDAGLTYTATARLEPTSAFPVASLFGPAELRVDVRIENPTSTTRDVWLAGCSAWIRLYPDSSYTNALFPDIPRGSYCAADPVHVTLLPGQAQVVSADGFRLTQAGGSLTPGTYHVAAAVDRIRDLLVVRAGPLLIPDPNAGLRFAGSTAVSGGTIRSTISFTNTNTQPVRLEYGACAVSIDVYRTADRSGKPAWRSDARQDPNGFGYGCLSYLATTSIAPGVTASPAEFTSSFAAGEVLGDSLPAAHYYFAANVRLNWRTVRVIVGDADVAR